MGTTSGGQDIRMENDRELDELLGSATDLLIGTVAAYEPLEAAYRAATAPSSAIREATDTSGFPPASVVTTASTH